MWYADISPCELQTKSLSGHIQDRLIAWRLMLGVLSGSLDDMVCQCWSQRNSYYSLKNELEPQLDENLPAEVFNPLSQNEKVIINQESLA